MESSGWLPPTPRGKRRSSIGARTLDDAFEKLGFSATDDMDEDTQYLLFEETRGPVQKQLQRLTADNTCQKIDLSRAAQKRDLIKQFEDEVLDQIFV